MFERQYSESEVGQIIEAAAERQRSGAAPASGPGLTLAEIERIGREAGIDPAHLRAAALALDADGPTTVEDEGAHLVVRRTLLGPIRDTEWEGLVAELEDHRTTDPYVADALREAFPAPPPRPGLREWRDSPFEGRTVARAVETDGGTQVTVRRRVGWVSPTFDAWAGSLAAAVAVGLAVGIGGGVALDLPAFVGVLAALLALAAAVPVGLRIAHRVRDRERGRLQRAVAGLPAPEAAPGGRGGEEHAATTDRSAGRIDPGLLDPDGPGGVGHGHGRHRVR